MMVTSTLSNTQRALQHDIFKQLAQLVFIAALVSLYFTLGQSHYPYYIAALLVLVLGYVWGVQRFAARHVLLARRLFIWGLDIALVIAMLLHDSHWLPVLGIFLPITGSLLMSRSGMFTVFSIYGVAVWLNFANERTYPLSLLAVFFLLSIALAWRTIDMLYTTLIWYSDTQREANRLLEEARSNQVQLSQTLRSLETAYDLRAKMQQELLWLRQRAEEAQRLKDRFSANISHELRTPLNLILGFSEVMHLSPEVYGSDIHWSPKLRRDIYQIYRSSRHLLEMIDDILDLSHFEMSSFTVNMQHVPLNIFLHDTLEMAGNLFENGPVTLQTDIEPDLPAIDMDPTRIRQALLNLLNNARRFTEKGTVHLSVYQNKQRVIFRIQDTGPGIPAEQQESIFQDFHQVDVSLSRKHGGAGLGLAITKRFVETHKGHIWVESEEGQGAVFTFALPLSQFDVPQISVPAPMHEIIVVDPDQSVAHVIARHLDFYEVVQVPTLDDIDFTQCMPHAVIDNVQPDLATPVPPLPVPYIRCSLPSQVWLANHLAVQAFLEKPVTPARLMNEIQAIGDVHSLLVVDDDRGFIQLVERIIGMFDPDMIIAHAYDGRDALAQLQSRQFDLILVDLAMPDMDGESVLKVLDSASPIIALTGASTEALLQQRGNMVISRLDGLYPSEVLNLLRVVLDELKPRLAAE